MSPDRVLTQIYRDVGTKLDIGLDITSATVVGAASGNSMNMMSSSDMMVAISDEEYNTRYGAYHGTIMAMRRVRPVSRVPATIDLVAMVQRHGLATTSEVVDHFQTRLLRLPLSSEHRDALIEFLTRELGTKEIGTAISYLEEPLRMLVHLIMSAPEYQLS